MTRPRAADLMSVAVGLALALLGVVASAPTPAIAHDALVASEPADGAVLASSPAQLVLTFNGEQLPVGAAVAVTGPDGAEWADGAPAVAGTTVTQALRAGMPSGAYAVSWRSVSGDGHPIEGTLGFTIEAGPAPDPVEPSPEPPPATSGPTAEPVPEVTVEPSEAAPGATEPGQDGLVPPVAPEDLAGEGESPTPWLVGALALATLAAVVLAVVRRR